MGARIIAGRWGGRVITIPPASVTRPMTDKLRSALFNILGPVDGLSVVDAYAGSGAIGLEALSRGAERVVAVELAKSAIQTIQANIVTLGAGDQIEVYAGRVEDWLKHQKAEFNLVIAGPPYDALDMGVISQLSGALRQGGLMVLWQASRLPVEPIDGLELEQNRRYGDDTLVFYKKS